MTSRKLENSDGQGTLYTSLALFPHIMERKSNHD